MEKINEPQNENSKWEVKVKTLTGQIKAERERSAQAVAAVEEMSRAMDSALAELALKFGAEVGDGTYELVIPIPKRIGEYDVSTVRNGNGTYTVRVRRKED